MGIAQAISSFANNDQLKLVVILIFLDIVLGVAAAVHLGKFAFTKVTAFLKDDVLGKVVPWFAFFAASKFAPDADFGPFDLNQLQTAVWAGVLIALVASLTSSANDLGLSLPTSLATGENEGANPKPSG